MILAARAGDRISSGDLITSYLQANDFDDGESLVNHCFSSFGIQTILC